MQTPLENPLMTVESFTHPFQIGTKERDVVKWGVLGLVVGTIKSKKSARRRA